MNTLNALTIFNTVINSLKGEDKYLLKYADPEECGISNLDEKHIQIYSLQRSDQIARLSGLLIRALIWGEMKNVESVDC